MKKNHHGGKTLKVYQVGDYVGAPGARYLDSISESFIHVGLFKSEEEPGWYEIDVESEDSNVENEFWHRLKERELAGDFASLMADKNTAKQAAKWYAQWAVEEAIAIRASAHDWESRKTLAVYEPMFYVKAKKTK